MQRFSRAKLLVDRRHKVVIAQIHQGARSTLLVAIVAALRLQTDRCDVRVNRVRRTIQQYRADLPEIFDFGVERVQSTALDREGTA